MVKELKKDVKQMQCTEATAHLLDHASYLIDMFEEAENHFGAAKCKEMRVKFFDKSVTPGQKMRDEKTQTAIDNLENLDFGVVYRAERPARIELPCQMGGGIELQYLTKGNKKLDVVKFELRARGFSEGKKDKDLTPLGDDIRKLKAALKQDEFERKSSMYEGLKLSSITFIQPLSEEMSAEFPSYEAWKQQKLGIEYPNETDEL